MRNARALILLATLGGLFARGARAQSYDHDTFRDIRWLGRGNTGTGTVDDATALFYNPGGLGFQEGYSFTVLNPQLGLNADTYTSISKLTSLASGSAPISQKAAPFLGKSVGLPASFFPAFVVPHFAAGFYDDFSVDFTYRNPVDPELDLNARNDYGLIFGSGMSLNKNIAVGASLRYQVRKLLDQSVTAAALLLAPASNLNNYLQQGYGWGMDLGIQGRFDMPKNQWASMGLTVQDLGSTSFHGANPPPQQAQRVNAGFGYGLRSGLADFSVLGDLRELDHREVDLTKKIFVGTELSFLKLDLRGGFYQGYWTAGLSFRLLPLVDLNFSSYGEEVDYAAGQRQNRVYMVGMSLGVGLKGGGSGTDGSGRKSSGKKYRSQLDALY